MTLMAAALLCAEAGSSPSAAATTSSWEEKLGPFLRRVALGTHRSRGRFSRIVPPGTAELLRALPPFVRTVRRDGRVDLLAKARLAAPEERSGGRSIADVLRDLGVEMRSQVGDIVSLRLPATAVAAVAALPEVVWLKASRRYRLLNESSTTAAHVDSDTAFEVFGTAGAGVIVGVVDTGIDWTHGDFRHDDGTTRILAIWDQTLTDAAHPPPPGFVFGAYYTRSNIDAALEPGGTPLLSLDLHGHGTHVAGSAAGNGLQTGNGVPAGTFAGVAPEADLVIVRVFAGADAEWCDDCDLTAAVDFIRQIAAAEGKPWVGNMSLGDDVGGAHDGTAPDELAIDAAVGPGRPGTQMVLAAGNSGSIAAGIHWQGNFAEGVISVNSFTIPALGADGGDNDFIWLDLWYEGSDDATVELIPPGGPIIRATQGDDSGIVCLSSGAAQVDASNSPDPANGDHQVFMQIWDSSDCGGTEPPSGTWIIRVIGEAVGVGEGAFHLWNAADSDALFSVTLATSNAGSTVTVPGTSRNGLTAGSYIHKSSWINAGGGTSNGGGTVGARSTFSGRGPTRDGRNKPDLAAPGEWVGSTLSSQKAIAVSNFWLERDGQHRVLRGTSMATPHVAGAAALLFGVNGDLDGVQVKAILSATARVDGFTGAVPNTLYGYGKVDVLRAAHEAAAWITDLKGAADGGLSGTAHPSMLSYNLYRAPLPGVSESDYGTCLASGLPSPDFTDAEALPPGGGFMYLFTGVYIDPRTTSIAEGSLGTDGEGNLRPNASPCP